MNMAKALVAVLTLIAFDSGCLGAALSTSRETDDSVCDLSPATTRLLGRQTFISASHSADDQAVGYRRLAAEFIANRCRSDQILILNSPDSDQIDSRYLNDLATDLCKAADIVRTNTQTVESPIQGVESGYELRCRISKFTAFSKQLQIDEAREPTDRLIARLRVKPPMARTSPSAAGSLPDNQPTSSKQDCSKLSLSAMLFGGGGCR